MAARAFSNHPGSRSRSATLSGGSGSFQGLPVPLAQAVRSVSQPGAYWKGMAIGVSGPKGVVKPVSATWPDAKGVFTLTLPASAASQTLRFWQIDLEAFSPAEAEAAAGGPIDLRTWPAALSSRVAQNTATVRIP